jgi:hypothetical protein
LTNGKTPEKMEPENNSLPLSRVDWGYLKEYAAGDDGTIVKYLMSFINSSPVQLRNMEIGLIKSDANVIAVALNTLKPQLKLMGMHDTFKLTEETEDLLRNDEEMNDAIRERVALIVAKVSLTYNELEEFKAQYE